MIRLPGMSPRKINNHQGIHEGVQEPKTLSGPGIPVLAKIAGGLYASPMVKTLAFNFRLTLLPSWGLVNIHTGIGIIRAEYVPNTENHLQSGAYAYDFKILDDDIPAPGDFGCDDLVEPYVTAYNANASCPTCFHGLPTIDFSAVQYVAALIPNQCGGSACLAMVPASQVCQCADEGGGGEPPDLSGYALLTFPSGTQAFTGNQSITGNLTITGVFNHTGNATIGGGTLGIDSTTTFSRGIYQTPVNLTNSDDTVTWNLANGNLANLVLLDDWTLANPDNIGPGTFTLRVIQGGGGGNTLQFGNNYRFPGGVVPTLSAADSAVDILTFVNFGGDDLYLIEQLDFQPEP